MSEFDSKARTWDHDPMKVDRANEIAKVIVNTISVNNRMTGFEYGCGTGLLGLNLRYFFKKLVLADNSNEMLAVLKEKISEQGIKNIEPVFIDLEKEIPPPVQYDVVMAQLALHHVQDYKTVLRHFYQMILPGGYVCIADLEPEDGSFHGDGFLGHRGFDPVDMRNFLENIGFIDSNYKVVYTIKKQTSKGEKAFKVFLITAKKPYLL